MVLDASDLNLVTDHDELRERYARQHGVAAGYLPSDLDGLDDWGEAGTRAGQYRSDLAADEAALAVLDHGADADTAAGLAMEARRSS